MNKLIIGIVNTDMQTAFPRPGFKENQIAGQQIVFINFGTNLWLRTRIAIESDKRAFGAGARWLLQPAKNNAVIKRSQKRIQYESSEFYFYTNLAWKLYDFQEPI